MAMKIIMGLICFFPIMLIMYGMLYFEGKRKGNILFGVTLWKDTFDEAENGQLERLQKSYKRNLMLVNLIVLAGFILCCIPDRSSIYMSGFMMLILVMIVIYFIPFVNANKKLKEIKNREIYLTGEKTEQDIRSVDIKAAAQREPVFFARTAIAGMLAGIIPFILECFIGKSSDMKGINLFIIGTFSLVGIIFFMCMLYFGRVRTDVLSGDSSVNMQIARVRHYHMNRALAVSAWANALYTFYIWIRMGDVKAGWIEIVISSFIYAGILLAALFAAQLKVVRVQNKYAAESIDCTDDDKYWLWGMIYYNKNDKRFMVNKRAGIGTTINMAKPAGKILMTVVIIILIASTVGPIIWMLLIDYTPVSLEINGSHIISYQLSEEYNIALNDVTNIELLEELPDMSKRVGTGMESIYKGSFVEREGEKEKCEVCVRIKDGPYIRLETVTGVYYLNDEKPEKTLSIYETIMSQCLSK